MGIAEALLAAVVENRDDVAAWAVLGDALQTRGDPRGALVHLMMAREERPSPRLFEAELQHRSRWGAPGTMTDTTWWRGFPIGIRIASAEALAIVDEPEMELLESVELAVDAEAWPAVLQLLARPRPWRRLRLVVKGNQPLVLAPLFTDLPELETLRIANAKLEWTGCHASRLVLLELENIQDIDLDAANLPALAELRLLGTSSARKVEAPKPIVRAYRTSPDTTTGNAFVVVGGRIEPALVGEMLSKMPGIEQIGGTVGHVDWPVAMTVIQLRSTNAISLMPYTLADAIAKQGSRVALIGLYGGADVASMNVLGGMSYEPRSDFEERHALVRATLDRMLGRDPGPGILRDLLHALDCALPVTWIGDPVDEAETLLEIDPTEPPPAPPPEEEYAGDYDDDYDEPPSNDLLDHLPGPDPEADYGDIPGEPKPVTDPVLVVEAADVVELDDELDPEASETPDDGDAWVRLDDQWESRETDPDDDASIRWPDPELAWNPFVDIDQLIYLPRCATCANLRLLRPCSWCGEANCSECALEDERTEVTCKSCLEELLDPGKLGVQSDAPRASYVDNPEDP